MNRIIKALKEFDGTLTINEVITKIKIKEEKLIKQEELEFKQLKEKYNGSFLKIIKKDSFGNETIIIKLDKLISRARTSDWDWYYKYNGLNIEFANQMISKYIVYGEASGNSLTQVNLFNAEIISKEEYEKYFNAFDSINEQIKFFIE